MLTGSLSRGCPLSRVPSRLWWRVVHHYHHIISTRRGKERRGRYQIFCFGFGLVLVPSFKSITLRIYFTDLITPTRHDNFWQTTPGDQAQGQAGGTDGDVPVNLRRVRGRDQGDLPDHARQWGIGEPPPPLPPPPFPPLSSFDAQYR